MQIKQFAPTMADKKGYWIIVSISGNGAHHLNHQLTHRIITGELRALIDVWLSLLRPQRNRLGHIYFKIFYRFLF